MARLTGYKPWMIATFPTKLKDKFVGACKAEGRKVPDVMEYIILQYLREQKAKGEISDGKAGI